MKHWLFHNYIVPMLLNHLVVIEVVCSSCKCSWLHTHSSANQLKAASFNQSIGVFLYLSPAKCLVFRNRSRAASMWAPSDLCHLRANPCCLHTQLFLLLLHLWIRLSPQVVWNNLMAEHRDALLSEFLWGEQAEPETDRSERCLQSPIRGAECRLTAKSSSRSGDRSRGIMTWLRKDGVFSFLSSLLMVFSWLESRAKLSRTDGLNDTNAHHHLMSEGNGFTNYLMTKRN